MKIYITHCSAKKRASLQFLRKKVTPDQLYTSSRIKRFMKRCMEQGVRWAIFSDKHGMWLPHEKHKWYDKHPDSVSQEEFCALVKSFDARLSRYNEILFYHHPARFNQLYKRLLKATKLRSKVTLFTRVNEITG